MKTLISIIIISILFFISCDLMDSEDTYINWTKGKKIKTADNSNIPETLDSLYFDDAAKLALRDIHADVRTKESLIEIPKDLVNLYYNGLIHVYNSTNIPECDSIVSIYNIHIWSAPEIHRIIVSVDSTKQWVHSWQVGKLYTNNSEIDRLIKTYDLELKQYYRWPWSHAAVLFSPNPINIFALCKKFTKIDGVIHSEPDQIIGDGNNITAEINSNYLEYQYSLGYGDCPSGCIYRRFWLFHIYYDGKVKFSKSFGDRPP